MSAHLERTDFAVALAAPNASRPTHDCGFWSHDVFIGPKRTIWRRRWHNERLFVPEPSLWTLETLRLVAHELAAFLPNDEGLIGESFFDLTGDDRERDYLTLSIWQARDHRRRVAVSIGLRLTQFSEPMRAVLATLPRGPVPLAGIVRPRGQSEQEMTAAADSAAVATARRRLRLKLEALSRCSELETLERLDRMMTAILKHCGLETGDIDDED
ncbi:MAG TPA: hypothetical protein VIX73_37655 [Kofleriaceae bacterium]|jgi:hypothetical protein